MVAVVYRGLCDSKRILNYSDHRYQDFMETVDLTRSSGMNVQGPANGFLSLLAHCGADCELTSGEIVILQYSIGKRINPCKGAIPHSKGIFQTFAH